MFNTSMIRLCFRVVILIVLSIGLWHLTVRPTNNQRSATFLPVTVKQLAIEDGVVPVELRCDNARLSAPNSIEKLSCVLKNNSNRSIIAGTISILVTVEHEGTMEIVSTYDSFDTFLQSDFHIDHPTNSIPPGGEYRLDQLSASYGDAVVKEISESIDYIEFRERKPVGPNVAGSRIISDVREGAAKYKSWLVREHRRNPTALDRTVEILNNSEAVSPTEIDFQNPNERQGADMLRKYLLRVYRSQGVNGLIRYLK
jgi:hypothetical protein